MIYQQISTAPLGTNILVQHSAIVEEGSSFLFQGTSNLVFRTSILVLGTSFLLQVTSIILIDTQYSSTRCQYSNLDTQYSSTRWYILLGALFYQVLYSTRCYFLLGASFQVLVTIILVLGSSIQLLGTQVLGSSILNARKKCVNIFIVIKLQNHFIIVRNKSFEACHI